eukprot:gene6590-10753_t
MSKKAETIKEILKVGSNRLLKKSSIVDIKKLKNVKSKEFELIQNLKTIVKHHDAYGVSSIQINSPKRIFIALNQEKYVDSSEYETEVYINPKILEQSSELERNVEGCLSVPYYFGIVTRPKEILVEYTSEFGERIKKEMSGYPARCFLHEYDHLEGILYLEKIKDFTKDFFAENLLEQYLDETGDLKEELREIKQH